MIWSKIIIDPEIKTIVDIKLEQKINEALIATITSLTSIANSTFKLTIVSTEDSNSKFEISIHYKKHIIIGDRWFYTYIAWNEKKWKDFLKDKKPILGKNILNTEEGLLIIDPRTHQISVSKITNDINNINSNNLNLINSIADHKIDRCKVFEHKIQCFGGPRYGVQCVIDTVYVRREQILDFSVDIGFYDYISDRNEVIIYDLNDTHINIGLNIEFSSNDRYIFHMTVSEQSETKKLYFLLDQPLTEKQILDLGQKITKTTYSYANQASEVSVKLAYIPKGLQIGMKVQYDKEVYFLWHFFINLDYCQLTLNKYPSVAIRNTKTETIDSLINEQTKEDIQEKIEDFIKFEEDKLFVRSRYKQNRLHNVVFSLE